MINNYHILAQLSPTENVLTALYTVPAATQTTVSSFVICNTNTGSSTFRVSVAINGAVDALSQYIYYDLPVLDNDTFIFTGGMTLNAGDIVRVMAANQNVAFTLFGVEMEA